MSQLNRIALKEFFETGDKPTEDQFIDLIDSCFNLIDDPTYNNIKITVSAANVLQMYSVPFELIPNPGPNKAIEVTSVSGLLIFNSIKYTAADTIFIITEGANQRQATITHCLDAAITRHLKGTIFVREFTSSNTMIIPNSSLLATTFAEPENGNSDCIIYLSYKIIDIP